LRFINREVVVVVAVVVVVVVVVVVAAAAAVAGETSGGRISGSGAINGHLDLRYSTRRLFASYVR